MNLSKVKFYNRNRDWVQGANLRIEEFRKRPVSIAVNNFPEGCKSMHSKLRFQNFQMRF